MNQLSNLTYIKTLRSQDGTPVNFWLDSNCQPKITINGKLVLSHNLPMKMNLLDLMSLLQDAKIRLSALLKNASPDEFKVHISQRGLGGGECVSRLQNPSKIEVIYPLSGIQGLNLERNQLTADQSQKLEIDSKSDTPLLNANTVTFKMNIRKHLSSEYGVPFDFIGRFKRSTSSIFLKDVTLLRMMSESILLKIKLEQFNYEKKSLSLTVHKFLEQIEKKELSDLIFRIKYYPYEPPREIAKKTLLKDWIAPFSKPIALRLIKSGVLKKQDLMVSQEQMAKQIYKIVTKEESESITKIRDRAFKQNRGQLKEIEIKDLEVKYNNLIKKYLSTAFQNGPLSSSSISHLGRFDSTHQFHFSPQKETHGKPRQNTEFFQIQSSLGDLELDSVELEDYISNLEFQLLQERSFLDTDIPGLITYYNRLNQEDQNPQNEKQKRFLQNIFSSILDIFHQSENSKSSEIYFEVLSIAEIHNKQIFRKFLEIILRDINSSILFEQFKIETLSVLLVYGAKRISSNDGRETEMYLTADDMMKCIELLQSKLSSLTIGVDNLNLNNHLDTICNILYILVLMSAKGISKGKKDEIRNTIEPMKQQLSHKFFKLLSEDGEDPTIEIKLKYIEECLQRIEEPGLLNKEWAKNLDTCLDLIDLNSQKGFNIPFDQKKVLEALKSIGEDLIDRSLDGKRDREWFEKVNYLKMIISSDFNGFLGTYFDLSKPQKVGSIIVDILDISNKYITFFIIDSLDKLVKDLAQSLSNRSKALQCFWHIYYDCDFNDHSTVLNRFKLDDDLKLLIKKKLAYFSILPKYEKLRQTEAPLTQIANLLLKSLCKNDKEVSFFKELIEKNRLSEEIPAEFFGKNLYEKALRLYHKRELVLLKMKQKCYTENEELSERLDLVEISGHPFKNDQKLNQKQVPLKDIVVAEFIKDKSVTVLLIGGSVGSGKTILMRQIERDQWKNHHEGKGDYLPIFVRLSEIKDPSACVEETLRKYGGEDKTIESLKTSSWKYLFILDGYDELKAPKNLWNINNLGSWGTTRENKLIISSRIEYLKGCGPNYERYFAPKDMTTGSVKSQVFREYRICELSDAQRFAYIEKMVRRNQERYLSLSFKSKDEAKGLQNWLTISKYLKTIRKDISGLEKLMKSPYMMNIIVDILPVLEKKTNGKVKMTRATIYKAFSKQRFEEEAERIQRTMANEIPPHMDLVASFYNFSLDLAVNMYLANKTSIQVESPNYPDPSRWKVLPINPNSISFARFFSNDPKTKVARSGAPIVELDGQVRFVHKSILEFFAARVFYELIKDYKEDLDLKHSILNDKLLYGGQKDRESEVLNFVVDMINDSEREENIFFSHEDTKDIVDAKANLKLMIRNLFCKGPEEKKEIENLKEFNLQEIYVQNVLMIGARFLSIMREVTRSFKMAIVNDENIGSFLRESITYLIYEETKAEMLEVNQRIERLEKHLSRNQVETQKRIKSYKKDSHEIQEEESKEMQALNTSKIQLKAILDTFAKKIIGFRLVGTYEGEYEDENGEVRALGKGRIKYENGEEYEGNWINNLKSGYGTYYYQDGSSYAGEWENDMRSGEGCLKYDQSRMYRGRWVEGIREGKGEYIEEKILYLGEWKHDKMNGQFTLDFVSQAISKMLVSLETISKEEIELNGTEKLGNEYCFNGENKNFIKIKNANQLTVRRNFIIELEFKTNQQSFGLFSIFGAGVVDRQCFYKNQKLYFWLIGGSLQEISPEIEMTDGKWHKLRYEVFDDIGQNIYIDDNHEGYFEFDHSEMKQIEEYIMLGYSTAFETEYNFIGSIQNFRIWHCINPLLKSFKEYKCEYKFDEIEPGVMTFSDDRQKEGLYFERVFLEKEQEFETIIKQFLKKKGCYLREVSSQAKEFENYLLRTIKKSTPFFQFCEGKVVITRFRFSKNDQPVIICKPGERLEGRLDISIEGVKKDELTKQIVVGFAQRSFSDFLIFKGKDLASREGYPVVLIAPDYPGIYELRIKGYVGILNPLKELGISSDQTGFAYVILVNN